MILLRRAWSKLDVQVVVSVWFSDPFKAPQQDHGIGLGIGF
jgi:hypothetical protein